MIDKLLKREISITVSIVIIVSLLFIAFSYAIFKIDVNSESSTITFGDIDLSFCKNETCDEKLTNIDNIIGKKTENGITSYVPIYPQDDPSKLEDYSSLTPYTFTITNTGDLDLYVSLYLEKDETEAAKTGNNPHTSETQSDQASDLYNKSASEDQIKIAIGEVGILPTIKLYSSTKNVVNQIVSHEIASQIYLKSGESKTFNLYAWLVSDAKNESQGAYFITKISAKGEYLPEEIRPESKD